MFYIIDLRVLQVYNVLEMYSISNAKKVIGGINTFIHDTNEIVIDRLLELALENIQDFTEDQKEKLNEVV